MTVASIDARQFGRAFEYAVAADLARRGVGQLQEDGSYARAKEAYDQEVRENQDLLDKLAGTGNEHICQHEKPQEQDGIAIILQPDRAGQEGDVRDVVLRSADGTEIGISAKRNHEAMKHSRLAPNIDFGTRWGLGEPCSDYYWAKVTPIFDMLRSLTAQGMKWRDLPDKSRQVYKPLIDAFQKEIARICKSRGSEGCKSVVQYLIGRHDFYKMIALDDKVKIQVFNLNRTLKVGRNLKLPTRLESARYKNGSKNTVILTFSHGWSISFRIHSARTKVEPSLKFDIKLEGHPSNLYTHTINIPD